MIDTLTLIQACAGTRYKPGSTKVVRSLLAAGADIEAAGSHLDRPLHVAITTGNTEIARILIEHGADITAAGCKDRAPLHLTAEYDNPDIMRLLLQKGAVTEVIDNSGRTPLHLCTESLPAQILIDHGAAIDHVDKDGLTPLQYAVLYEDVELFKTLHRWGASARTRRAKIDGRNISDMIEDLADHGSKEEFFAAVKGVPLRYKRAIR